MVSFAVQKLLSSVSSRLFIFIFIIIVAGFKKKDTAAIYVSVLPMFSSKSFIVSGLTFRSLVHFEFMFLYAVRKYSNLILLNVAVQLKRLYFLYCIFLPPLS